MSVTRCKCCKKPLAFNETAWASMNGMYCSHECGVEDAIKLYDNEKDGIVGDIRAAATAYFNDVAEEINREDYGARSELECIYSKGYDITTLFRAVYEGDDLVMMTVVGWHYGEPYAGSEEYEGDLVATYVDMEDDNED